MVLTVDEGFGGRHDGGGGSAVDGAVDAGLQAGGYCRVTDAGGGSA